MRKYEWKGKMSGKCVYNKINQNIISLVIYHNNMIKKSIERKTIKQNV